MRGRSAEVALALAANPIDDLRAAIAGAVFEGDEAIDLMLIAAPHDFGADLSSDAEADRDAIRACRERGVVVATFEPMPGSVMAFARPTAGTPEVAEPDVEPDHAAAVFVPRLRSSRSYRELSDTLEVFGAARVLQIEALCRPGEGSLGARLYDALDAVRGLLGDPESVHAVYCAPAAGDRSARDLPTDSLRDAHGTLSVNLQFPDGRCAHVLASDAAARWTRTVTLLGDGARPESGMIRAGDEAFYWVGADGAILDSGRASRASSSSSQAGRKRTTRAPGKPARAGAASSSLSADVIAGHLRELLSGRAQPAPPIDTPRVLATAGAVLLSARTGQAESVATVLRMMGMGVG